MLKNVARYPPRDPLRRSGEERGCVLRIGAHLCRSLVDISELQHNERGGGRRRLFVWRGLTAEIKAQNTRKEKCNNGRQHSRTHARRTKGEERQLPGREITAENLHPDRRHN